MKSNEPKNEPSKSKKQKKKKRITRYNLITK